MKDTNRYVFITSITGNKASRFATRPMTLNEAVKYYRRTLELGRVAGYEKVNVRPRSITALLDNISYAASNIGYDEYTVAYTADSDYIKSGKYI